MDVVGKVSSIITQGMYSVATPFHPFGGAVDIIVVKQQDGTFRSTPWYVRFGKFQGVLKGAEKVVQIEVNGVEADFHMYLDNSGEAYFVRDADQGKDGSEGLKDSYNFEDGGKEDTSTACSNNYNSLKEDVFGQDANDMQGEQLNFRAERLKRVESDAAAYVFYEFSDDHLSMEGSPKFSEYSPSRYDTLDSVEHALETEVSDPSSGVVLVSVDGHILTAPISSSEKNGENVQLSTPQFHLGPGGGTEEYNAGDSTWDSDCLSDAHRVGAGDTCETNSLYSEHHLSPREGDAEHLLREEETQDKASSVKEHCIESSPETKSTGLKRNEVFKSCLELPHMAMQSTDVNQETVDSSIKIHEATEDPHEKSLSSPSENCEAEKTNIGILRTSNELSPRDSGCPISVSFPDLRVEEATNEKYMSNVACDGSDKMRVQFASDVQGSQEQVDVNLDNTSNPSGTEDPAPELEDKYSKRKSVTISTEAPLEDTKSDATTMLEISLCGNLLHAGMGSRAAGNAFDANLISLEEFKASAALIVKNKNLVVRLQGKYLPWQKAAHIVLGIAAFGLDLPINPKDVIPMEMEMPHTGEDDSGMPLTPSRRWRLWPIPFRRVKTLEHTSSMSSNEESYLDSETVSPCNSAATTPAHPSSESPRKQIIRTNVPTTDQIESLNLKEGQNMVNFIFSTRVLGSQKVEAHIYLWKWNTRIVISDVDGTITKSDVLGQFMPLVGKDWTHSGIAQLFSAIKENGYQLLFLSARAIVQSYLTKSFLFNLKQDGKSLPTGPVVISPDGLFPSLYREVIRRAPHEFKIACLEDIKALFPPDYNPFYAGFGNRDTDELSYRKIGIAKGKIFIINPKGEVAINHCIDLKSYASLHTLVNDMFPPTSLVEQEDYNSWNFWKMPLADLDSV